MESDLIVTILTEKGERHDLFAKGANGRSKRRSHLELMNLVNGTFYEGKTHEYLQDIQCKKSFFRLKENLQSIMQMNLLLEIIEKTVLENDPHPKIFTLLKNILLELNEKDPHILAPEIALTKLAHELGFLPNFKECSSCHKALTEDKAKWDGSKGTVNCIVCAASTNQNFPLKYRKALEFFKIAKQGEHRKIQIAKDEHKVIKDFLPGLFLAHLDKPLKSLNTL